MSGSLIEIGADELRFRSWEVERLFRDFYQETFGPTDLAALARRTDGWAAGLQLFHLATKGKPLQVQRKVLRQLTLAPRVVHEYLARNVLDELPPETSRFLLETAVLGCLTGTLCDRLLDTTGSDQVLIELERGQVFTAVHDDGTYRYHEVLRSYLEVVLVQRLGEAAARDRYRTAAGLLEDAGAVSDAVRAYARAGDEESAAKLLATHGEAVLDGRDEWVEGLPPTLVDHDPWLQLAQARRSLAAGRWAAALAAYRAAESRFGSAAAVDVCHRERLALAVWLDPLVVPPVDTSGLVRSATHREPLAARRRALLTGGAAGVLAAGLAALLAGQVRDAAILLDEAASAEDAGPVLALGARMAGAVARTLAGRPCDPSAFEDMAIEGERAGVPWLARLARALGAFAGEDDAAAADFRRYCEANGDRWGTALAACLEGFCLLRVGPDAIPPLHEAADGFRALGAGVLESWARAAAAVALAESGHPDARAAAQASESLARATGSRGAQALAFRALAAADADRRGEFERQVAAICDECGLDVARLLDGRAGGPDGRGDSPREAIVEAVDHQPGPEEAPPPVVLRCLGGFDLVVGGIAIDCSTVKPRARACLRILALNLGRPVHRETLVASLWPDIDAQGGLRNLHVVMSALRHLLEPGVARGASSLIVREGESYRLNLPPGSRFDLVAFENAMKLGRAALARDDRGGARAAFAEALDLYGGDLLADAGPAEWVVAERERYRASAADAAQGVAEIELAAGQPAAAAIACERGLRIDRHRDRLWRLRIEACDRAGDRAGSARARTAYDAVLAELGLPASDPGARPPI